MTLRHLVNLTDLTPEEYRALLKRAIELKAMRYTHAPLNNRVLAMLFEKSSTRTRISFEAGMIQLGGSAIFLSPRDTQLGRQVDPVLRRLALEDRHQDFIQRSLVARTIGVVGEALVSQQILPTHGFHQALPHVVGRGAQIELAVAGGENSIRRQEREIRPPPARHHACGAAIEDHVRHLHDQIGRAHV